MPESKFFIKNPRLIKTVYDFKETSEFRAGSSSDKFVYIGSRKGLVGQILYDIKKHRSESKYLGQVLCPEIDSQWTYEKNMAFFAGVIAKKRTVILTTPISFYLQGDNWQKITVDEILWLLDNQYTIQPIHDPALKETKLLQTEDLLVLTPAKKN
ncbi:MAG: hypothetical protein AAGG80_06380, partial [Pseudomonadota bacterium]